MIVNVIGLGATAQEFKPDGSLTLCVNDTNRLCDYRVIVDRYSAFSDGRQFSLMYNLAERTKSGVFSQLTEWDILKYKNFTHIDLKAVHAHNNRWNEFIPSSNNSPFVACGVAYKYFNATEIRLWGVDFNDHPNINGAMREQSVKDFQLLQKILNEKGCRIIPHENSYLYGKV